MKKFLYFMKGWLNKIFGTSSDEFFWRFRHVFDKNWAESYVSQSSLDSPHRKFLVGKILSHMPFKTLLEVGCGGGKSFSTVKEFI